MSKKGDDVSFWKYHLNHSHNSVIVNANAMGVESIEGLLVWLYNAKYVYLELEENKISDISYLDALNNKNLYINVCGNKIINLSIFESINGLKELHCSENSSFLNPQRVIVNNPELEVFSFSIPFDFNFVNFYLFLKTLKTFPKMRINQGVEEYVIP
jgi:hypothetical protein